MITRYFDDIQVGEKSVTRSRTITEADIVNFAYLSGDWYPLHCDAEYAKKSPFGDRIAHGLLILSAASGLTPLEPGPILAFYGMDRVRFVGPVKIGDTIRVETVIAGKEEKNEKSGVVTVEQEIKNQRNETVVKSIMKMLVARGG
ncbi:MAG: MaoC/PaaZ C-terminal domain-containing protein [Bacillota bacterium]